MIADEDCHIKAEPRMASRLFTLKDTNTLTITHF
jgi:hypothetical protein